MTEELDKAYQKLEEVRADADRRVQNAEQQARSSYFYNSSLYSKMEKELKQMRFLFIISVVCWDVIFALFSSHLRKDVIDIASWIIKAVKSLWKGIEWWSIGVYVVLIVAVVLIFIFYLLDKERFRKSSRWFMALSAMFCISWSWFEFAPDSINIIICFFVMQLLFPLVRCAVNWIIDCYSGETGRSQIIVMMIYVFGSLGCIWLFVWVVGFITGKA